MKTKLFPVLVIAAGLIALASHAQANDAAATPAPTQVVYSPRLPSAAELSNAAAAQGMTIERIIQTSSQMTLVYHTASGQTNTVAYMLLPSPGSTDHVAQETHLAPETQMAPETHPAMDATVAQQGTTTPQVVYAQAPATQTVVYAAPAPAPAYYSPYYYPAYYSPYYAPVSFSIGFGYGYYGGYYGYHGAYCGYGYHGGGYHGGGGHH
jgi:hypothetical protein